MNPYSRLIPRLNGAEIEDRFDYYLGLAKKGVAGFIIFGGELEIIRDGIRKLQAAADHSLIIASDLEQGLGQQVKGGTVFPPAMAIASALSKRGPKFQISSPNLKLLKKTLKAIALEAGYAGINTIFAPVLDINTNPENPIIATRAFGEDSETVSFFGCEMVKILQENGIMSCGKHFPGHGDTEIDSHMSLPVVKRDLLSLEKDELVPFKKAIEAGVSMIMLGHLSVPAIDPSADPVTISKPIIAYLRSKLDFKGIVISDAMNMGALAGYEENEASLMALAAGVDIILHPSDPDRTASYLMERNWSHRPLSTLFPSKTVKDDLPDFNGNQRLSDDLARSAITVKGKTASGISEPFVILLKEDNRQKGSFFINAMKERFGNFGHIEIAPGDAVPWHRIPGDRDLIVGVFSQIRAWKGPAGTWLLNAIEEFDGKAAAFISFGNPYVLRNALRSPKILAYWDAESSQKAAADMLSTTNA